MDKIGKYEIHPAVEWYTPPEYIDAVRAVLGRIDLDPASSERANEIVGARRFFTAEDDGLSQDWHGNVFMTPPYSQPLMTHFAEKLIAEYEGGRVAAAIALTHNYTDTSWFHSLARACSGICFTRGRVGFLSPSGQKASPTQGPAFFYFGRDEEEFLDAFADVGLVVGVRS